MVPLMNMIYGVSVLPLEVLSNFWVVKPEKGVPFLYASTNVWK